MGLDDKQRAQTMLCEQLADIQATLKLVSTFELVSSLLSAPLSNYCRLTTNLNTPGSKGKVRGRGGGRFGL